MNEMFNQSILDTGSGVVGRLSIVNQNDDTEDTTLDFD
jgi:hypothetical protein